MRRVGVGLLGLGMGCWGGDASAPAVRPATSAQPEVTPAEPLRPLPEAMRCPEDGSRGAHGCFVRLPGGTFLMGAQSTKADARGFDARSHANEGPPQTVTVGPFWLQSHEVLAGAFQQCLDAGGCRPGDALSEGPFATVGVPGREELPATGVTWPGADRYCRWLGARLPTEAEWAFAAQGTEGRRFPWGASPRCGQESLAVATRARGDEDAVQQACGAVIATLTERLDPTEFEAVTGRIVATLGSDELVALCGRLEGEAASEVVAEVVRASQREAREEAPVCVHEGPATPADMRSPSPEGLFGLGGNLWEWTADSYVDPAHPKEATPDGPRVQRGGSWMSEDPFELRAAVRVGVAPAAQLPDVGVRCAWSEADAD